MKNIAIVGCGSRGQMFARLISRDKNSRLAAIAETVADSLELVGNLYDAEGQAFCLRGRFFCTRQNCRCGAYLHAGRAA